MRAFLRDATRPMRGSFCAVFLFATIFGINIVQCLSLLFFPISKTLVRKINVLCAQIFWSLCVFCVEYVAGVQVVITGDEIPMREQALVFANHQVMPDILVILCLAFRKGRIGDLKWFVKDPFKYIPGIGWGLYFLDSIFVKREWARDHSSIAATFSQYKKHRIPFWLISFLEGTRATPEKILRSQEYAKNQGLPVLQHVLTPRTKGFLATVEGLKSEFSVVYDLTIGFEGKAPGLFRFFLTPVNRVHLHCKRYTAESLPKDTASLSQWVLERYQEKDKRMASFYTQGFFS